MPIQSTKPKSEQFLHKRLVRQSIVALTNAFICAWSEYRVYFSPPLDICMCVSLSLSLSEYVCVCVRTLLFSFQSLETDVDVRACVCAIISLFISCWSLAAPKTWKKMDKSVFANVLLRQRQLYWFIWLFVCCCSRVCIYYGHGRHLLHFICRIGGTDFNWYWIMNEYEFRFSLILFFLKNHKNIWKNKTTPEYSSFMFMIYFYLEIGLPSAYFIIIIIIIILRSCKLTNDWLFKKR